MSQIENDSSYLAHERPAQILIIDDDDATILIIESCLRKLGYEPLTADNARFAFSLLTKHKVDIILMDIMMPGINGLELTRALRNSATAAHLIIVAVTSDVSEENKSACFRAGVDDFLPKPVDLKNMRELIEIWVSSKPR